MASIYGDRWETIRSIGEGGQAYAFLVKDLEGDDATQYVLKRLKNPERLERFRREIEAVKTLDHPYIVQLIDFDINVPKPYMVTEYCSGGSLDKAEPFWTKSPIIAIELFEDICEGVGYAHSQDVIHRDIKPSNIYLRTLNGPAVIGDFGICHIDQNGERITLTDEAVGSRIFMAPELEGGGSQNVSKKCDTYSLGKVLYWLLSGGKMLPRERHRDVEYDLKRKNEDTLLGGENIYMEHINRILDLMLVADPQKRRSVENILILTRQAKRLIYREFSPIADGLRQPCTYCGQGFYVDAPMSSFYSGLHLVDIEQLRLLVCNACGHIQIFRTGERYNKEWWKV